jgi:galactokinase
LLAVNSFISEVVVQSPGRINFIGGHLDYNGGHVLPAAMNQKITLKFRKNDSHMCNVASSLMESDFKVDLNNLVKTDTQWHNFIIGVLFHINILKPGLLKGFDCVIESDLALGAGLSSSAALECGLAKGVNELFEIGLTETEIIKLSRDTEHTFIGTKCGIMDQLTIIKGKKDHLLFLNCETLAYDLIKIDFKPYVIVLLNSNVSHNLANSAYNKRRDECSVALTIINKKYPYYKFLSKVPLEILNEFKHILTDEIYHRALYVIEENIRSINAVGYLKKHDFINFGNCLYQAHYGLQQHYEVSCEELDFLVKLTEGLDYVLGSRMMGGGFGGCTINIVHSNHVDQFIMRTTGAYRKTFNRELSAIITTIDDGASIV